MPSVKVLSRVRHNDRRYEAGEVIDGLTEKQARQLVDSGEATFDLSEGKASEGKATEAKSSTLKENVLKGKGAGRKSVTEKAQARAQADVKTPPAEPTDPAETDDDTLPVSFTTPNGKYGTNERGTPPEGEPTEYFKDGEPIDEEAYRAAYEQSLKDAGNSDPANPPADDDETEDPNAVDFEHEGNKYHRGTAKNGQVYYTKNSKGMKKVEFLQVAEAAGVELSDPQE